MIHPLDRPLADLSVALRRGEVSASELAEEAVARHEARGERLHAYKTFDAEGARRAARAADRMLADPTSAPPLCGIPFSIKDLYGTEDLPTFAGTARELPERWRRDAWLVARLREQGAVPVGKTHTVELAFGAVGINPHWGTPRNPWDPEVARIPGGSSCGAGVSLWEGSALVALGTDTGGSIRIPASMTGVVGHKTTYGLWPTEGVVPLSHSLDTVGALTRSAADSLFFFDAVEEHRPGARSGGNGDGRPPILGVPDCDLWTDCQPDIARALDAALERLAEAGARRSYVAGSLLDEAAELYLTGGIAGAECRAFLEQDMEAWMSLLDPTVGARIQRSPSMTSERYRKGISRRGELVDRAPSLFAHCTVLALPGAMVTPPPVADLVDLERYIEVNAAALRPTSPVNLLGLCAVTIPVALDDAGMPVGLQLVASGGADRHLLQVAWWAEERLGGRELRPPGTLHSGD